MKRLALRLVVAIAGYGLAVVVASQIALSLYLVATAGAKTMETLPDLPMMMLMALIFTGTFAFFPAAAFIALGEVLETEQSGYWIGVGAATAPIALAIMDGGPPYEALRSGLALCCLIGGAAGGYAYARLRRAVATRWPEIIVAGAP